MSDTKILLYMGLLLAIILLVIFRPTKRPEPSRLKMKEPRRRAGDARQLSGARWVAAENVDDGEVLDAEGIKEAQWVNPTIQFGGRVLDAYSVLGLIPGATLEQVHSSADRMLTKATNDREKQKIRSAVSAIESALID